MTERTVLAVPVFDQNIISSNRVHGIRQIHVELTVNDVRHSLVGYVISSVNDRSVSRTYDLLRPRKIVLIRPTFILCNIVIRSHDYDVVGKLLTPPTAMWLVEIV